MKTFKMRILIPALLLIIGFVFVVIGVASGGTYGNLGLYKTESFTKEFEKNNIEKINVNYSWGKLIIKEGSELKVVADNVKKDSMTCNIEGDTLSIEQDDDNFFNFTFISNHSNAAKLTLYIPDDIDLSDIYIGFGAGELNIKDITADSMEIHLGAGESNINNIDANEITINSGTGEFNIENSKMNDLSIESGVGEINIDGTITGECSIKSGVGEVNINSKGDINDYSFNLDNGIGTIRINGMKYNNPMNNGASNYFDIKNGIGEININIGG